MRAEAQDALTHLHADARRRDGASHSSRSRQNWRFPKLSSGLIEAELSVLPGVLMKIRREEDSMDLGKGALLWLLGVPLPIILLLALFWHH
jgi:hypothetical protein